VQLRDEIVKAMDTYLNT